MLKIRIFSIAALYCLLMGVMGCVTEVPVASVSVSPSSLSLTEGESSQLQATVSPSDATDPSLYWTSSDNSVASVTSSGRVSAMKPGSATITAKAGEKSGTCRITVNAKVIPVSSITLSKTELALTEGDSETLTATVKPDDATDKTVTWSSSDQTVASVDAAGKVTAKKAGTATITAKAGDKTATCKINVEAKVIPVSSITLDKSELTLTEGDSETLTATVKPDDATDKTVTWSSSDQTVASVDAAGKVTANKAGSATITAKAGEQSVSCEVTVKQKGLDGGNPEAFGNENKQW